MLEGCKGGGCNGDVGGCEGDVDEGCECDVRGCVGGGVGDVGRL